MAEGPMRQSQKLEVRPNNGALNYLYANDTDPKVKEIVECFPHVVEYLYSYACESATDLFTNVETDSNAKPSDSGQNLPQDKIKLLTNSIFDLQLTVYFSEFAKYLKDSAAASILLDAILYQATGCESQAPTEDDFLVFGTHMIRGIEKYKIGARRSPSISDIEGWMFGKEYSTITSGKPNPIIIMILLPYSIMLRVHAMWHIRHMLFNTVATDEERASLNTLLTEMNERIMKFKNGTGDNPLL
jgi:hypothetical protein